MIKLLADTPAGAYEMIHEYFSRPGAVLAKNPAYNAFGSEPSCLYRTPDGHACAVGCLIADQDYTPELESVGSIRALVDEGVIGIGDELINFLINAQQMHDNSNDVKYFLSWLETTKP